MCTSYIQVKNEVFQVNAVSVRPPPLSFIKKLINKDKEIKKLINNDLQKEKRGYAISAVWIPMPSQGQVAVWHDDPCRLEAYS